MSDSPAYQAACLARFRAAAKQGRHPAASHGERIANQLAKAIQKIGDDMALLDPECIEGFHALCQLAHGPWATDEQKATAFRIIDQAAG